MQLSEGQQAACEFLSSFILETKEFPAVTITGYLDDGVQETLNFLPGQLCALVGPAGTGKTTVVKHVLESMHKLHKTQQALGIPSTIPRYIDFTATTNKAAEALEHALNRGEEDHSVLRYSAKTIHSHFNLVMKEDPKTLKDVLTSARPEKIQENGIIFIDEASYVDFQLLYWISTKIGNKCKIIFMGDKYQCKTADGTLPVFEVIQGEPVIPTVELTQIMRQADGNPIQDLAITLRNWVRDMGKTPVCPIDNKYICWFPRDKFNAAILKDMSREEWTYETSKVLAYRNRTVNALNKLIYSKVKGKQTIQPGDYVVNNQHISGMKNKAPGIGTDRMVYIQDMEATDVFGEPGFKIWTDSNPRGKKHPQTGQDYIPYFMPTDKNAISKLTKRFTKRVQEAEIGTPEFTKARSDLDKVKNLWVDLRPVYSQTVHKSQGSTFRRVFIDLEDLSYCFDRDQLRRLLYVAVTRASVQVVLTGDIP